MTWVGILIVVCGPFLVALLGAVEAIKYMYGLYSPDFFGKRTAFLMNLIPVIPEFAMVAMAPFWATYWAIVGVRKLTEHVDKEWEAMK